MDRPSCAYRHGIKADVIRAMKKQTFKRLSSAVVRRYAWSRLRWFLIFSPSWTDEKFTVFLGGTVGLIHFHIKKLRLKDYLSRRDFSCCG
ncbi:hypothetical protein CHARACLAT_033185 [Characodon lateralis]|uniref:Uncharacterized protein n=1 Tax=Characodon lateralis TaxID=208331 RepID=A0ABU7EZE5_9TELE|nr:hypothetical protein [Characodon lateralis]